MRHIAYVGSGPYCYANSFAMLLMHDPHGHPYAQLPIEDFMAAWRAETVDYGEPFTMRTDFQKVSDVADAEAIRSIIPAAIKWLSMATDVTMPPGSLGNGEAARRAAELVEAGAADGLREDLIYFAIRAGARMLSDTADCLLLAGYPDAAQIAATQARLVGSMQHPVVTAHFPAAAALRALAPTYDQLCDALSGPHRP